MTVPAQEEIDAEMEGAADALKVADAALNIGVARSAISSGYYAMYHAAKAVLWHHGKDAKTHRGTSTKSMNSWRKVSLREMILIF